MSQSPAKHQLVVQRGPKPQQPYPLFRDLITIGRDIANEIVFSDPEVSRRHLRIRRVEAGYEIEDLGSTNGTYLNQERLESPQLLNDGDLVGLGETILLKYERHEPAPDRLTEASPIVGKEETDTPATPAQRPDFAPHAPKHESIEAPQASPAPRPTPAPSTAGGYGYEELPLETTSSSWRWVLLVGTIFTIFFCCIVTIAAIWIIDDSCSWDRIPVLYDLLESFGISQQC